MSTETINLALKFSYIGKNYHGNALQGDLNTVSYQLTKVLKKLNIYITDPILCGRTDKGVNAKNMVCNISVKKLTNCNYANYLNYHLPTDISIKSYAIVPETFHARYNCIQRHYRYYFTDYNPIMDEVCTRLKLVRDFKGMCKDENDTKRTLDSIYIEKMNGIYVLNVKAKGFLYNMVRKIFWVLSHAHLQSVDGILEGKQMAGTVGPEGLVFCCAKYECEIGWIDAYRKNNRKEWIVQKEIERFINDFK